VRSRRLSWRRLCALVSGLSADSVWRLHHANRPLTGDDAERAVASFMK